MLQQVQGDGYMRAMRDHQRGFDREDGGGSPAGVREDSVRAVEAELKTAPRENGAAGYDRGYEDAAAGRSSPSVLAGGGGPANCGAGRRRVPERDVTAWAYRRGFDDHAAGRAARGRRLAAAAGGLRQVSDGHRRERAGRTALLPAPRQGRRPAADAAGGPAGGVRSAAGALRGAARPGTAGHQPRGGRRPLARLRAEPVNGGLGPRFATS